MRFYLFQGASRPSCANFTLMKHKATAQGKKTESIKSNELAVKLLSQLCDFFA